MALKQPKSKVELHVHLDGAIRIQTLIDLAKKKQYQLPSFDESCLKDYVSISLNKPSTLAGFLECFKIFYPLIRNDTEAMERIAYEFCEDQAACGVLYFEVRYSPHALCTENSAFPDQERVSPKAIVEAVNRGLKKGAEDFGVIARSILCCMRHLPDCSMEVVSLCQEFASEGVVGIDIAGNEPVWEGQAMEGHVIAYKEAKRLNIHRTVHAGEAGPAANVKIALDILHAERIGHGYHVIQDAELYRRTVNERIHLEVCPTSSILTGAVKPCFKTHPLRRFVEDGVNFSINSDDPLVCQTRVDLEQGVAFNKIGLTPAELTQATFNAARSAFLPENEKHNLIEKLKLVHGIY